MNICLQNLKLKYQLPLCHSFFEWNYHCIQVCQKYLGFHPLCWIFVNSSLDRQLGMSLSMPIPMVLILYYVMPNFSVIMAMDPYGDIHWMMAMDPYSWKVSILDASNEHHNSSLRLLVAQLLGLVPGGMSWPAPMAIAVMECICLEH